MNVELPKGKELLKTLLNKVLTIQLTDGRTLQGLFVCVDRDANIIIGSAAEYSNPELLGEPRILGLAMVPGRHVVSIHVRKEVFDRSLNSSPFHII
jgi:small nuclear ribonucleoprotein (snRNP)-like protein